MVQGVEPGLKRVVVYAVARCDFCSRLRDHGSLSPDAFGWCFMSATAKRQFEFHGHARDIGMLPARVHGRFGGLPVRCGIWRRGIWLFMSRHKRTIYGTDFG